MQLIGMAYGHGQGVGGIGARCTGQAEQHPDHMLHLVFSRLAVADNRLFYRPRAIVKNNQAVLHGGDDGSPPGMAQFQGRARVGGQKDLFDGGNDWSMHLDHLIYAVKYFIQPIGKGGACRRFHDAAGDKM